MKKTKLNKISKQKVSTLDRKLKEICKRIVRATYPNVCYTCGQTGLMGSNWQTGHVPWPKGSLGAYLKWDLRLLRPQCYDCNINLGGMGGVAYPKMLKEIGLKAMQKLEADKQISVQAVYHYPKLIEEYTLKLKELEV